MSNDELQKAIDDITSGEAIGQASDGESTAVEMPDSMGAVDLGAPSEPALSIPDMGAMPAASEVSAPATDSMAGAGSAPDMGGINIPAPEAPAMPSMSVMPTVDAPTVMAPEATAAPATGMGSMPAMNAMPEMGGEKVASADMEELKKDALLQLYPLLEGMNVGPKQRYDICMKVVEKTGEKEALKVALNATREMTDPSEKGAALMKIIDKIDTL